MFDDCLCERFEGFLPNADTMLKVKNDRAIRASLSGGEEGNQVFQGPAFPLHLQELQKLCGSTEQVGKSESHITVCKRYLVGCNVLELCKMLCVVIEHQNFRVSLLIPV